MFSKAAPALLKNITFLVLTTIIASCGTLPPKNPRPQDWARAVQGESLDNFYQVDNKLYRSAQPSPKGMKALQKKGIKHVLNLRYFHSDKDEARQTNLQLHRVAMVAHNITYPQLVKTLRVIHHANSPVLVHCLHGSDRTGTVVAAYRMVFQNWSKEKAINELKYGGYGFHYALFPNIPELLQRLDVKKLREDVLTKT